MLQKIQTWLKSQNEQIKKKEELTKAQAYYRLVKAGGAFIQFIQEDMKKNQGEVNRHIRRRMQKELNEQGVLSPEIVNYYQQKIDYVLVQIHQRLNPPKVQAQNNPNIKVQTEKPKDVK